MFFSTCHRERRRLPEKGSPDLKKSAAGEIHGSADFLSLGAPLLWMKGV